MIQELPPEKLRRTCDPMELGCKDSSEVKALETIVGQERAVRALHFGLGIQDVGFNIYVSGLPGTGRTAAVKRFLDEVAEGQPAPPDWCYVNNFQDSTRPKALRLPAGSGRKLQADLKTMVEGAEREIRHVFESEDYANRREETMKVVQAKRDELLERVNERARQEGFLLQATSMGIVTIPLKGDQPMSQEDFMALKPEERQAIAERQEKLQDELETSLRQAKSLEKTAREELQKLDRQVARYAFSHLVRDLLEKYKELPEVVAHIQTVADDLVNNLEQFREEKEDSSPLPFLGPDRREQLKRRYGVNVLVDNAELKGAPVLVERNPNYNNLFGRIEQQVQLGALVTDFTLIRAGSLHRANGGYLVMPAQEVLASPFAWESLKRALANREVVIEDVMERLGYLTTRNLQPEPIPLDLKVVLIGKPELYQLMLEYDEEFTELFKVKAEFGTQMDRSAEHIHDYTAFVGMLCATEGLKHLDQSALALIVEHGSRLVEDQEKLSTRFRDIADVIREANYYAVQANDELVTGEHVHRAIEERYYRSNLIQERIQEMITRGSILIDVQGEQEGQVNGLSVIDLGDLAFGQPNRITASISLGREGVIDIEREAKLGGPIHTKGVLILSGYLAEKYAQDKPLSLSARLVFEQSYSGVEGDSASSTELYALLSSLSGLPVKQGIAVTGSVNQKGLVQAIGGVNEKIEGFYEICKARGLTGEQGVIIPASNVANLMLKNEVVEAVREGKFHVWPVETVDQGIEILTGVQAGKRDEQGQYPQGSVNQRVDQRLRDMAERLLSFGKAKEEGGNGTASTGEQKPAEEQP
jgi:lon-related putative ATP-dependent protease